MRENSDRFLLPNLCRDESIRSFIRILKKGKTHQQQLLMFPYKNMQNSNGNYNWKIKEMEGSHLVWLAPKLPEALMRDEERVMWRFSSQVRPVCLTTSSGYVH